MTDDRFYFRQLLAGRDFAREDPVARQMVNFVYLIGDRETGEAVAVDPAYAPGELVDILGADGMRLTGALVTHYHPDHVGGSMGGWNIAGASELLALPDNRAKIHIQTEEAWGVKRVTGCSDGDLVLHSSGDVVEVGAVRITLIHTPGHTPGSVLFRTDGWVLSGDVVFAGAIGRSDFPNSSAEAMERSLDRFLGLPDDLDVFPGHGPRTSVGRERATNPYLRGR